MRASIVIADRLRRFAQKAIPARLYRILAVFYNQYIVVRRLGFWGLQQLNALRTDGDPSSPMKALNLPNLNHPLWVRPGGSPRLAEQDLRTACRRAHRPIVGLCVSRAWPAPAPASRRRERARRQIRGRE